MLVIAHLVIGRLWKALLGSKSKKTFLRNIDHVVVPGCVVCSASSHFQGLALGSF
jgi:hypothetical protein|tara:strand:+ start:582 stop:746 length:165 start_codon:yes stop_codon:yes gene_type:complete